MKFTFTATTLAKWLAYGPVTINRIYGRNDSTAGVELYLLLFEAPTAAASAVPSVAPLTMPFGIWFDWEKCPMDLKECYMALSTDANTLVAPTAGQGVELTVEFSTNYPVITNNTTLVGDLTSAVAERAIWNNATGPKTLVRLDIKNNSGLDQYAFIAAKDSPLTEVTSAMKGPFLIVDATTKSLFFHTSPFEKQVNTLYDGCLVVMSETPTVGSSINSSADFNIRGIYVS